MGLPRLGDGIAPVLTTFTFQLLLGVARWRSNSLLPCLAISVLHGVYVRVSIVVLYPV